MVCVCAYVCNAVFECDEVCVCVCAVMWACVRNCLCVVSVIDCACLVTRNCV